MSLNLPRILYKDFIYWQTKGEEGKLCQKISNQNTRSRTQKRYKLKKPKAPLANILASKKKLELFNPWTLGCVRDLPPTLNNLLSLGKKEEQERQKKQRGINLLIDLILVWFYFGILVFKLSFDYFYIAIIIFIFSHMILMKSGD